MIAEGKLLGPKHKQKVEEEVVEYEPFDFPDGRWEGEVQAYRVGPLAQDASTWSEF